MARGPLAFWSLLKNGTNAVTEFRPPRWNADEHYHPNYLVAGKMNARYAGQLEDVLCFDHRFFGISLSEASRMDVQQRLLLEVAVETFEDAGLPLYKVAGRRVGVFAGVPTGDYGRMELPRWEKTTAYTGTGSMVSIAANRVSYQFDLRGPSVALDTACSSSLIALHLARQSILTGDCEMALAGGVNVILTPDLTMAFSKTGILSASGRCASFDAKADGYVRSEGVGWVLLKSLPQALADHDRIYALVSGSATNQDGRTNGLTAPNRFAQIDVIERALVSANVEPASVGYVEAHGTGTILGDTIEARALGEVYSRGRTAGSCLIGSVKANIGHTETAAGIAGVIKLALSLFHKTVPASIHFTEPNPNIHFDQWKLEVAASEQPWPDTALGGVSSFGFGGSNCHAILRLSPLEDDLDYTPGNWSFLFPISGHTPAALIRRIRQLREFIEEEEPAPRAFSHQLIAGCNHHRHRLALVASNHTELLQALGSREPDAQNTPPGCVKIAASPAAKAALLDVGVEFFELDDRTISAGATRNAEHAATISFNGDNLMNFYAQLYASGIDSRWSSLAGQFVRPVSLPPYPWEPTVCTFLESPS
jgi:acyl transferase domain-containing protein